MLHKQVTSLKPSPPNCNCKERALWRQRLLKLKPCNVHGCYAKSRFGRRVLAGDASVRSSGQPALLIEVDGILLDMHIDGHRVAFNKAFADLGLDCANWSPPVYNDLLQRADGSGERMVMAYFNMTNWPLTVQTNEQDKFAKKVICSFSESTALPQTSAAPSRIPTPPETIQRIQPGVSTSSTSPSPVSLHIDSGYSAAQPAQATSVASDVEADPTLVTPQVQAPAVLPDESQQPAPTATSSSVRLEGSYCELLPDERLQLVQQVLEIKKRILRRMLANGEVPLRPGVTTILDAAMEAGTPVAALAGTLSERDDDSAACALRLLGPERSSRIKLFSAFPSNGEDEGTEEEEGEGASDSFTGSMAMAAAKMKQREAANFVRVLKQANEGMQKSGVDVVLDGTLTGAAPQSVSSSWLVALSALLGCPVARCLVLASSGSVVQAAAGAGMVAVAVPRQFAARADFPGARAKFDSMGPGAATWGKLSAVLNQGTRR